ncbi:MAG TPA: lamin tail domain-containing protein [Pyrinomonadaceae bacterium]|nr:lamin tail domain-containing protein [Pyrinomonadaceae bacterium]
MRRPVRMSIIAISTVLVLFTMQIGVAAKKKSSKRRHRTARSTPVVVTPPVFSPVVGTTAGEDDVFVNNAAPTRVAPSAPARTGGMSTDSAGDSGNGGKRSKGRITIGPAIPSSTLAGTLIISEFRVRGPNGANDEFIEIYNNSGANHTVASISGGGYAVATSAGVIICTLPNTTVIPAGGHFICVNTIAFSLATYPSGSSPIGSGDATYGFDIPDQSGIALFNNNTGGASFTLANRFDAVGPTAEANTLYREGAGLPTLTPFSIDYSWLRDECGKGGAVNQLGKCTISTPKDTDDNAADFYFVDTNGTSAGGGQRLGAPGPQGLSSPIQRNSTIPAVLLDATVASAAPPNRVRDFTSDPANNSTFGTLSIRRRFTNNTGAGVTRLRFRVIDVDTFPAASGFADLRPRTSSAVVVAGINDAATCTAAGQATPCSVTVQGTTLEVSPAQPNGGGFNSSLGAGTVTLGTPLANGASIDVQFLLGIQQTGSFRIYVNIEALP